MRSDVHREFDRTKSLQQLEGHDWGEPTFDSYLVKTCHRLRRKPIVEFSVEDLRIMSGQRIGIQYLVPIAMEVLEADPLAEGSYYPGDLLGVVLSIDASFWSSRSDLVDRARSIVERIRAMLPNLDDTDGQVVLSLLRNANSTLT